jgi:iron complex outermembrane recepter protein
MRAALARSMLWVSAIVPLWSVPALAQSGADQADEASTGDIVVTAQRRDERLRDVPISVTALSSEALSQAGVTNTLELAKVTPGVTLPLYGAFVQPSIRGISSSGAGLGDSPNVAIYIDGVYQANQVAMTSDLPDAESVQVLKGPQGSLYGQNAAGGAIIITTRSPEFTPAGTFTASYGRFNDVRLTGFVTTPLSDTWAISIAGAYRNRDGYNRDLLRGRSDPGLDSYLVRGKLLWRPQDTVSLTLSAFISRRRDSSIFSGPPFRGNSLGVGIARLPCNFGGLACLNLPLALNPYETSENPEALSQTKAHGVSLASKFEIGSAGTLNAISSYRNTDVLQILGLDQTPVNTLSIYLPIKERDFIQEVTFVSNPVGPALISAGLFYMNKLERYVPQLSVLYPSGPGGLFNTAFPALNPIGSLGGFSRSSKRSFAAFAELTFNLTDQLSIIAAGRYSHERQQVWNRPSPFTWKVGDPQLVPLPDPRGAFTFDKFTPRAVIRFKPNSDHTVFASYSQGFKSGYVNPGNVNACTPQPACLDAPVRPETVDAFEIGYKGRIASGLDVNLSGFHYIYKDIQVFVYNPGPPPASTYQNAARGEINGFEVEINWRPLRDLTLNFGGSYLDAKYKDFRAATVYIPNGFGNTQTAQDVTGKRMMRTPEWTLNGSARYSRETGAGLIGGYLAVSYNSGIFFDPNNRIVQPGYALVDAELSFAPSGMRGLRLVVWGKNLTDRAVLQMAISSQIADQTSYAEPRTFGVRAEYSF